MKYKFLEHTADIKFQAFGGGIEKCFENAAYALKEIICKSKVKNVLEKDILVKGNDFESLLYNFLEELLFLFETENFIWGRFKISVKVKNKGKDLELKGKILGDKTDKYELETHVKAITYNQMFVKFDDKNHQYICQVVVDV
jgi:SHS2 domain-containing protein